MSMSESEPSALPSDDLEPKGVPEAEGEAGTADVTAAASAAPKRPLVTVSRVIVFGLFFIVIYMLIQDRLASSRWTAANEWIKAEMEKADENGIQRSHVASHMLEEYGLYPEDHLTLPTYEYYHWPTMVRVFTIKVQFTSSQVVQRHTREVRYNWMEFGEEVPEEVPAGAKKDLGEAPPAPGLPGGGGGGGRPPGN